MEIQVKNRKKSLGLIKNKTTDDIYIAALKKDKATGEIYLTGMADYYKRQQSLYKNYAELERAQVKSFLETMPEYIRANFSNLWQH